MRSYYLLTLFVLSISLLLPSCQNSDNSADQPKTVNPNATANPFTNATTPAPAADPASFSSAQPHYKCPNNCAGGSGPAKGNCPVCGTEMAHNQAYHNNAATAATSADPEANAPVPAFNATEPHYKCPNNCAGGHGPGKGNCPVCGTALAHNTAYHNSASSTTATPTLTPPAGVTTNTSTAAATNAAGVFHYTCANGCAGGAAEGVACSTCGATLVHNTAYHN
ncbi:heavy metal-binding domain-containing protein [Flavilitoribacter nigricans]|uniref:Heavy metal binding domain-containing protein n=1 Tax=Flavilitoribacter nigricans (strain ATCC 23147 / DSM 23189 / NBRC 102662 / NCIMB 1420 / SS-2) TaxID=1122177 RepID=A0A2D0NEJ6_FLAN2|nr:heavy metal-binding domain-containing protein [Flavilitoribacter nigricans]PHN06931.1 hypothetical protein CRP01_08940 [Flavilitoribacter nigricans DSM 23189 = NBRC 102662]